MKLEKETYEKAEVEVLIAQATEEKAGEKEHQDALAAKDAEVATEKARAEKAEADLKTANEALAAKATEEKDANAQVAAEKFWTDNEKNYPAENKDEIIGIAKKMELGTASKDESLKLVSLKKTESSLSAAGGDAAEAKRKEGIDKQFGITDASNVKA